MVVRNGADRYSLVIDALNNSKRAVPGASELKKWCEGMLNIHRKYIVKHLEDMPAGARLVAGRRLGVPG